MLSRFGRARYGPDGFHMLGESDRPGPHRACIGQPVGRSADRQTPRSGRPLAATVTPVYRSGAGLPRQAATSSDQHSEALQARGPQARDASVSRGSRLQSTPVDCLVDYSGYEGPRSR